MVSKALPITLGILGVVLFIILAFLYIRWWARRAVYRAELARDLEDTIPNSPPSRTSNCTSTTLHSTDLTTGSGSRGYQEMAMAATYPHFAYPGGAMAVPFPGVITIPLPSMIRDGGTVIRGTWSSKNKKKGPKTEQEKKAEAEKRRKYRERRKIKEEKYKRKQERKKAKREEKEKRRKEEKERRLTQATESNGEYPEYPTVWPWFF